MQAIIQNYLIMKHYLLFVGAALLAVAPFQSFAQTEQERIAALENTVKTQQTEIVTLQGDVKTLKDRYAVYQQALNIRQILKVEKENLDYGITSVEGDNNTGDVTVNLYVLNKSNKTLNFQFANTEIVTYDGIIYKAEPSDDSYIGNKKWAADLRSNIMYKAKVIFRNVPTGTRIANFHFDNIGIYPQEVLDFKDIAIEWK